MIQAPCCPYCGKDSVPATGKEIYPAYPDLHHKKFFLCAPCKAYVGTHEATGEPLGTLADAYLRRLRNRAHEAFDWFWKGFKYVERRKVARTRSYAILAKEMGIAVEDCHIGMFDPEKCLKVIEICKNRELFRSV